MIQLTAEQRAELDKRKGELADLQRRVLALAESDPLLTLALFRAGFGSACGGYAIPYDDPTVLESFKGWLEVVARGPEEILKIIDHGKVP